jgi:hypothetical protein
MCARSSSRSPAAARETPEVMPAITIDLYGGVFADGENTNMTVGDYVRNHPTHAPLVDAAWQETVLATRKKMEDEIKKAEKGFAREVEKIREEAEKAFAAGNAEAAKEIERRDRTIKELEARLADLPKA